jgi:two-component system phosphate regulon response regulator PhoB
MADNGKIRILVVDDEEDILELLRYNISKEGFDVIAASNGTEGISLAKKKKPDLIILDLMMPDIDGLDVCRELKSHTPTAEIPVIMLTARVAESDIVAGFDHGADDYVSKPFSPKVLIARIKAVLRRRENFAEQGGQAVERRGLVLSPTSREVQYKGEKIELTFSEFEILGLLMSSPGRAFSRKEIMAAARGDDYLSTERAMDVQIVNLRKKLREAGQYINTVRGEGYKFD